jgi:hypothetical protein
MGVFFREDAVSFSGGYESILAGFFAGLGIG